MAVTTGRTPPLDGELEITRPDAYEDRTAFWSRVRRERPVAFSPTMNMWIVSTYDTVLEVVRDTSRFGKLPRRPPVVELVPEAAEIYAEFQREYVPTLENNAPIHSAYRQKVLPALSAPRMEARRPVIEQMANALIDEFASHGEADLIERYCFPLPALHSFDMIGVPAEDVQLVRRLSIGSIDMSFGMPGPDDQIRLARDVVAYWRYLLALVEDHRASQSNTLVNDLIMATGPEDAPLTDEEIASLLVTVIRAAHRTTTNLIGNTLHAVMSRPELWRRLVADSSLARAAVEESLRRNSPAPGHFYAALVDTELAGVSLREGDQIYVVFASANHDDTHFSAADEFDIDREQPRESLSFGAGPHMCAGKALGRVSGGTAVETFVRRLPSSRLLDPTTHWIPTMTTQGLARLDVAWDGAD
jgi:cytochrome P450